MHVWMHDNRRGIDLLDMVENVVAVVFQVSLQKVVKEELPESLLGFKKGRNYNCMIFTFRQLVEKSFQQTTKLFYTYIELKKA